MEAAGDGTNCSVDINQATNTKVQIGWTRGWYLMKDNTWVLATETIDQVVPTGDGAQHPHARQVNFPNGTGRCNNVGINTYRDIQRANKNYTCFSKTRGQFTIARPKHYYRYHAWSARRPIDLSQVKGLFGETYIRPIKDDPTGVDDRHLANYVAHISSDGSNTNNPSVRFLDTAGISVYEFWGEHCDEIILNVLERLFI